MQPFDVIRLMQKGSLYLTRPTLGNYIATQEELQQRATAVLNMIASGKVKVRIAHIYPLQDAQQALCKHVDAAPAATARPKESLPRKRRTNKPPCGLFV